LTGNFSTLFTGKFSTLFDTLEKLLEYRDFKGADAQAVKFMEKDIAKKGNPKQRETMITHRRRKIGVADRAWTTEFKLSIGVRLMELVIDTTGLFEKDTVWLGRNKSAVVFRGTEELREWLKKQHSSCALLQPFVLPMIHQPKPWTTPFSGGFYTIKTTLLKTVDRDHLKFLETQPEQLVDVYSAINALQDTRWRINKQVLEVMRQLWDVGGDRAKLPPRDGKTLPDKPFDIDTNEESRKAWKMKAREVYDYNNRATSKIMGVSQKISLADKFKDEEAIHFAYSLDWRGRAYPIGTSLHPQGDDSAKALLEFAEGKAIGDNAVWLYIHIANCYGYDKAGFDARVQWVKDREQELLNYATDPLGYQGWTEAADPFLFLASCFDFLGWYLNGKEHISHLPIQVDGTCNGLQNYSAMLRDPIGGKATNLIPSDKPQDIYQTVADKANVIIERDISLGLSEAIALGPIMNRKLSKRNTMTVPYAATLFGMRDQLVDELNKMAAEGDCPDLGGLPVNKAAGYLAKVNYEAIGSTVVAARQAMDWLKDVAKIVATQLPDITWTTPTGLLVKQAYKELDAKRVKVVVGGKEIKFTVNSQGSVTNSRKQVSGIAPNFIHSCDAAHMMRTINKAKANGITNFSFIHDSYGTLAADMTELSVSLRESFVEQYTDNVLENFRNDMVKALVDAGFLDEAESLPPVPPMGTLDLSSVLESPYFFA
jgi:DNA-directed RNA polymerase